MAMLTGNEAEQGAGSADVPGLRESLVNSTVMIAAYDTRPIGCIMASPGPQTVLHNLVVLPAHRNRGHASDLIGATIELLERDAAVQSFWTAIDPRLHGGVRRFERHGFVEVSETACGDMKLMTRPSMASTHLNYLTSTADPSYIVGSRPVRQIYEASLIG
ncbi:GNAT family N-acetyltransferase [Sphingomonas sp. NFX23]|uniref:GNAT family N-acetyltransferase n=1 Tax=Sphingomonas sp. NFX23 TaxID=2819532 RepID=UPI003CE6DF9D